jgi:hypothetical protein
MGGAGQGISHRGGVTCKTGGDNQNSFLQILHYDERGLKLVSLNNSPYEKILISPQSKNLPLVHCISNMK